MNHTIFTYPNLLKLQIESFSLEELISDYENIYNTTTSKKNLINNYTPMTVTVHLIRIDLYEFYRYFLGKDG